VYGFVFMATEAFIFATLIFSLRRGAFCPFPDIAIVYLAFLEMVLFLQINGNIDYEFLASYSSYSFEKNFGVISSAMALYSLALMYSKYKSFSKIDYKAIFSKISIPGYAVITMAVVFYILTFTIVINMNLDVVWKNDMYLLMASPDVMKTNSAFTSQLIMLINPISLLSSVMFFLLYMKGDRAYWIFFPIFIWWLLFLLGSHSRNAALLIGIGAFLAMFLGRRWLALGLLLLVCIAIPQALVGRSGNFHGISQVGNALPLAYKGITEDYGQIIANTGEGVFVSAEALNFHPVFPTSYVILSFSPLVNAIDGYQDAYTRDGIRLSEYVPMSAINEAVAFGWPYFIIYIAFQIFAGRATTKVLSKNPGLLPVFMNVAITFGFLQQFAYALRTCFRWFFYPLVFCFFV